MVKKTECYVDTSAFIAFLDRSDSFHALFRRLFSAPSALITSALVIAEGHGWFLRQYDQRRALQFLAFIDALPSLTVRSFGAFDLIGTGGHREEIFGSGSYSGRRSWAGYHARAEDRLLLVDRPASLFGWSSAGDLKISFVRTSSAGVLAAIRWPVSSTHARVLRWST